MKRLILAIMCLSSLSQIARPAETSQTDYEYFKENSYSQYSGNLDPADIEDQFYKIAATTDNPKNAVSEFAKQLSIPFDTAQKYVGALIEAVRFRKQCHMYRDSESCAFESGVPLFDALLDGGLDEESGGLAVSIGKVIPNSSDEERAAMARFIGIVYKHPARALILSRLYDYRRDPIFAAALVATDPTNVQSALSFRKEAQEYYACEASQYGSFLALLEIARKKAAAAADEYESYLLFTEAIIWAKLRFGLASEAIQDFNELSDKDRSFLAETPPEVVGGTERQIFLRENANFLLDVAYAKYSLGDPRGRRNSWQIAGRYFKRIKWRGSLTRHRRQLSRNLWGATSPQTISMTCTSTVSLRTTRPQLMKNRSTGLMTIRAGYLRKETAPPLSAL